jgi:hypothetical protein
MLNNSPAGNSHVAAGGTVEKSCLKESARLRAALPIAGLKAPCKRVPGAPLAGCGNSPSRADNNSGTADFADFADFPLLTFVRISMKLKKSCGLENSIQAAPGAPPDESDADRLGPYRE